MLNWMGGVDNVISNMSTKTLRQYDVVNWYSIPFSDACAPSPYHIYESFIRHKHECQFKYSIGSLLNFFLTEWSDSWRQNRIDQLSVLLDREQKDFLTEWSDPCHQNRIDQLLLFLIENKKRIASTGPPDFIVIGYSFSRKGPYLWHVTSTIKVDESTPISGCRNNKIFIIGHSSVENAWYIFDVPAHLCHRWNINILWNLYGAQRL